MSIHVLKSVYIYIYIYSYIYYMFTSRASHCLVQQDVSTDPTFLCCQRGVSTTHKEGESEAPAKHCLLKDVMPQGRDTRPRRSDAQ